LREAIVRSGKKNKSLDLYKTTGKYKTHKAVKTGIYVDSTLIIILSNHCHLGNESVSDEILSKEKLKLAIDFIFTRFKNSEKRFSFIVDCESDMTWSLIEWAIEYINLTNKDNQKIRFSIRVNCNLPLDDKIDFIKNNNIHIGIQKRYANQAIETFGINFNTIEKLINNNISFVIRFIITKSNVNLMKDIVYFFSENYKNIKLLRFEHDMKAIGNDIQFYDDFVYNFFEARKLGKEKGIYVHNYLSKSIETLKTRCSRGSYCFTEKPKIISCNNDSTMKLKIPRYKREGCNSCFAKWNCSESYSIDRLELSNEQQMMLCAFIKKIITKLLEEQLLE
jgi:hypothetical protein